MTEWLGNDELDHFSCPSIMGSLSTSILISRKNNTHLPIHIDLWVYMLDAGSIFFMELDKNIPQNNLPFLCLTR